MSGQHTQGRLITGEFKTNSCELLLDGKRIATVLGGPIVIGPDAHTSEDRDAHARRLAACWNACLGVRTDELEVSIGLQHAMQAAERQRGMFLDARAQRDQLLEALKETWRVIDAAGLDNLSRGVQLGQTVWYVKASDAKQLSGSAIAACQPTPTVQHLPADDTEGGAV